MSPSRRSLLAGTAGSLVLAGCATLSSPGRVDLTLINRRSGTFSPVVTLERGDRTLWEEPFELEPGEQVERDDIVTDEALRVRCAYDGDEYDCQYARSGCSSGELYVELRDAPRLTCKQRDC